MNKTVTRYAVTTVALTIAFLSCQKDKNAIVNSVTLDRTNLTLTVGNSMVLYATVQPSDAFSKALTWSSSASDIASVDALGKVTAVAKGTATVTVATREGLQSASCVVTVNESVPVTGISISWYQRELYPSSNTFHEISATVQPPNAANKTVTWSSSNTDRATINIFERDNELVYINIPQNATPGLVDIIATTEEGHFTATCTIKVIAGPPIAITPPSILLKIDGTQQLTATIAPDNATYTNVTWSSSNPQVATISHTGFVTAITAGTTTITATALDGYDLYNRTASCPLDVVAEIPFSDGSYYVYQSHTIGPGIDLVFMGDGYTVADIAKGHYEAAMRRAIEGFFDVEPYRTYRAYFNVYIVGAESIDSGIGTGGEQKNTRFSTYHRVESGLNTDNDRCFEYAQKAPINDIDNTVIVLLANSTQGGGICYMWTTGRAIAICAFGNNSSNLPFLVQHEAGGHGFAKLADEYIDATAAATRSRNALVSNHNREWYLNVDITDDHDKVIWKEFIGKPQYSMVGTFEGAYYFETGVWRPEQESIMRNGPEGYYNAPSRAAIVKRIKLLAGEPFDLEWFMFTDIIEPYRTTKAAQPFKPYPPLAPPVIIDSN